MPLMAPKTEVLNTDVSRTAVALIREHGDQAPVFAAMEADAALEAGDLDGAATWRLVVWAIKGMVEPDGTRH